MGGATVDSRARTAEGNGGTSAAPIICNSQTNTIFNSQTNKICNSKTNTICYFQTNTICNAQTNTICYFQTNTICYFQTNTICNAQTNTICNSQTNTICNSQTNKICNFPKKIAFGVIVEHGLRKAKGCRQQCQPPRFANLAFQLICEFENTHPMLDFWKSNCATVFKII